MDAFRRRHSPAATTDRFLGLFSSPAPPSDSGGGATAGDEFHEDEVFFSSEPSPPHTTKSKPLHGDPYTNFGLLAALYDGGDKKLLRRGARAPSPAATAAAAASTSGSLLRRKATIAAASAAATPSPKSSPTSASAALAIPVNTKPKQEAPAKVYIQSAPVKVPVRPPRRKDMNGWGELDGLGGGDDDDDDDLKSDVMMLPPHEIVARASASGTNRSPMAPFSMLEGVGRTLKGRDLRLVRDAVLQKTGFLD